MDYYGLETGSLRAPLMQLDETEREDVHNVFFVNGFLGVNNRRLSPKNILLEKILSENLKST